MTRNHRHDDGFFRYQNITKDTETKHAKNTDMGAEPVKATKRSEAFGAGIHRGASLGEPSLDVFGGVVCKGKPNRRVLATGQTWA